MKIRWWIHSSLFGAITLVATVELVVISNLARINNDQYLRLQSQTHHQKSLHPSDSLQRLKREALSRAALYDQLIQDRMLVDGMVVHRGAHNEVLGLCDSLLFSSIRYYALTKLGLKSSADAAWAAIKNSRVNGQWQRHPRCNKSLSRDMVMGVLVALAANPKDGDEVFYSMLEEIDRNWGFAGDGPFYVSWLSPGIAGLLRLEAEKRNVPFAAWPWNLKHSFSSIEFDALFLDEGYVSHLAGLGLWLEHEHMQREKNANPRSLFGEFQRFFVGAEQMDTQIDEQRRQWIAGRLRAISMSNLFFEIIDHKTNGSLDHVTETRLLSDLLLMPQFPATALPQDCNRDADYLWQRRDGEALPVVRTCGETWNGVDFLWVAALLDVGNTQQPQILDLPVERVGH